MATGTNTETRGPRLTTVAAPTSSSAAAYVVDRHPFLVPAVLDVDPLHQLAVFLPMLGREDEDVLPLPDLLRQLGQPTWQPGSPAGWDDIAASWAGPDALVRRVEVAQRLADRAGSTVDARALAEKLFPGSLGESTRTAIARAESPAEGLALLLVSPEFVRR